MTKNLILTLLAGFCTATGTVIHAADFPLGHKDFVPSPQHPVGWNGDGTGVFPGATPLTEWNGPEGQNVVKSGNKIVSAETPVEWNGPGLKNILWSVPMPHQTMASPIVVKGKVITLADPHTILAYDANTGKRLWFNAKDNFDLLCQDQAEAKKLRRLYDLFHRQFSAKLEAPRRWPAKESTGIDLAAEKILAEREFQAAGIDITVERWRSGYCVVSPFFAKYGLIDFSLRGFAHTMSTPVSDGTSVWVLWSSTRIIACYDVESGKCSWMRWLGPHGKKTGRSMPVPFNSPVLADGVLVLQNEDKLWGLDPSSGKNIWELALVPAGKEGAICSVGCHSCETPLVTEVNGKKAVFLWNGAAIDVKTGATVFADSSKLITMKDGKPAQISGCGTSLFFGAPDIIIRANGGGQEFMATRFSAKGIESTLWEHVKEHGVCEESGQSIAYEGYVYPNNSGTSALIEIATGKIIPRGIAGPNAGYPGCYIAGKQFFNFNGKAACTVTTLGPEGKLIAINHLVPGYPSDQSRGACEGHGTDAGHGFHLEWWKQAFAARDEGVIGWVGRTFQLAAGEMTAGPFFQGDRMYLRTYTHLICIGGK